MLRIWVRKPTDPESTHSSRTSNVATNLVATVLVVVYDVRFYRTRRDRRSGSECGVTIWELLWDRHDNMRPFVDCHFHVHTAAVPKTEVICVHHWDSIRTCRFYTVGHKKPGNLLSPVNAACECVRSRPCACVCTVRALTFESLYLETFSVHWYTFIISWA